MLPATQRTPALAEYEKLRFGCSFHFSMPTFTGDDYDVGAVPATTTIPPISMSGSGSALAHELGAKYAILTAKYMSGFCLWDSKGYDYDVANSGNKTDVVAAFVAACKEFGLRPGFYYCILDPHNEGQVRLELDDPRQILRADQAPHRPNCTPLYPNTFYQLFDITWKLTPAQRWELYRLVKKYSPDCIIVDNQGFKQSRVNQGRTCEAASWPSDVINGEDTLPPLEGHDPHVTYERKQYYMPFETWLPTGPLYPPMPWMHTWFWHPWYKTQSAEPHRPRVSRLHGRQRQPADEPRAGQHRPLPRGPGGDHAPGGRTDIIVPDQKHFILCFFEMYLLSCRRRHRILRRIGQRLAAIRNGPVGRGTNGPSPRERRALELLWSKKLRTRRAS